MLNTGFLEKFIHEFHSVHNRIQYDEYHLYPVDKHLLRTVQTVKKFGTAKESSLEPLCDKLYRNLKEKRLLLWAALLHDIGKMGIPDSILLKPGPLSEDEIRQVQEIVQAHEGAKGRDS